VDAMALAQRDDKTEEWAWSLMSTTSLTTSIKVPLSEATSGRVQECLVACATSQIEQVRRRPCLVSSEKHVCQDQICRVTGHVPVYGGLTSSPMVLCTNDKQALVTAQAPLGISLKGALLRRDRRPLPGWEALDRCLAPFVVIGRDMYDFGSCWLSAAIRCWEERSEEEDEADPQSCAFRASKEVACVSALLSVVGGLPVPATPGLVLASAHLGPFTAVTYALSLAAASMLTMCVPVLLQKHPQIRQRKSFRAVAAASAAAATGQLAFMILSLSPSLPLWTMLPGVTVSDFISPMENPFMVLHLLSHSINLPLMNLVLGRLAGRSATDMSTCHHSAALYSICVILSAATKAPFFRWPLLIIGGLCLKKALADVEESSRFVETLAPHQPRCRIWMEKHKICVGLFVCQASLYPTIQSMGYLEWLSTAAVQSTWTVMDCFLTSGIAFLSLKDPEHVMKSEDFMARKERIEHLPYVVDTTMDPQPVHGRQ